MFPLTIDYKKEDEGFIHKSSGRSQCYWNIAFYNTKTRKVHLLDSTRRMLFKSYQTAHSSSVSDEVETGSINPEKNLLFYSVILSDYNHDGKLDESDPEYLFISDKSGYNFKQVSPDNLQVTRWQMLDKNNEILIEGLEDTNTDGIFGEDDQQVVFIYNIQTGNLSEVFNKNFVDYANQLFKKQWGNSK